MHQMRLATPIFERPVAESAMLVGEARSLHIETFIAFGE